jgi:(p)ppGpp synthase/HD superfamily hydrolase
MYLNPTDYQKTKEQVDGDPRLNSLFLTYVESTIKQLLDENSFQGRIETRVNGCWALKKKQGKFTVNTPLMQF